MRKRATIEARSMVDNATTATSDLVARASTSLLKFAVPSRVGPAHTLKSRLHRMHGQAPTRGEVHGGCTRT
jgi:hypothetical protein